MMRMFVVGLLCCSFVIADKPDKEAPKKKAPVSVVKDGKLTNTAWNLVFEARGLESGMAGQDRTILFSGRAAGGIQIEIRVLEGVKKQDGKAWRDGAIESWTKEKRKLENVQKSTEGIATVMYTETKLDVFTEEHGFAFYARGYQCFLVHCYVADKTDKSTAKIKGYLGGLKLGEDPGVALHVMLIAQQIGKPMDDPLVLLAAGLTYADPRRPNYNYPIAAKILTRARKAMKDDTYDAVQTWQLYESGGMAYLVEPLRELKTAIEWFNMAENAAKKIEDETDRTQKESNSGYNLACAYSLNGDIEKGYAALHRAFAKTQAVDKAHLDKDTDLDNLKKNKELWDKFWKECVAGK